MKAPEECCEISGTLTTQVIESAAIDLNAVANQLHHKYQIGIEGVIRLFLMCGAGIAASRGADIDWISAEVAQATAQGIEFTEKHLKLPRAQ